MINRWFKTAAALMLAGVALGAFGAHGLKQRVLPEVLKIYETGVFYHFVHALGLFVVAQVAALPSRERAADIAGGCFLGGIVLFSGSLYLMVWTGVKMLGIVTPFGGALFLIGWANLIGLKSEK